MRNRWLLFIVILASGILASAALSLAGLRGGWGLFLLLPFIFPPFFVGRRRTAAAAVRTCPECGFATSDPEVRFCPRDGSALH